MGSVALPLAALGSGLLGGIFAPQGQELSSFENAPGIDPREMAGDTRNAFADYLKLALADAAQPVTIDTTAAPLPSFSGGGLPMNISAPALDPARLNPDRRTWPGIVTPRGDFGGVTKRQLVSRPVGSIPPEYEGPGQDRPYPEPPPPILNTDDPFAPRVNTVRDAPQSSGAANDGWGGSPPDGSQWWGAESGYDASDLDQAQGAIALLMQQLQQGTRV